MEPVVDALAYVGVLALGYLVGSLKPFLGNWLTDWRRQRQARKRRDQKLRELCEEMPTLLGEMQADLDEHPHVREFIVLNKRAIQLGHQKPRFEYYRDEHDNFDGKLSTLKNQRLRRTVFPPEYPSVSPV